MTTSLTTFSLYNGLFGMLGLTQRILKLAFYFQGPTYPADNMETAIQNQLLTI